MTSATKKSLLVCGVVLLVAVDHHEVAAFFRVPAGIVRWFLAVVLAAVQLAAVVGVGYFIKLCRLPSKDKPPAFFFRRLAAHGIGSALSGVISLLAAYVIGPYVRPSCGLLLAFGVGFMYMLMKDAVLESGSLGKKLFGVRLVADDGSPSRNRLGVSLGRNLALAFSQYACVISAGPPYDDNKVVLTIGLFAYLAVFVDGIYFRRHGIRIADSKLHIGVVRSTGPRPLGQVCP